MSIAQQIIELYIRKRSPKDIDYNPQAALLLVFITIAITTIAMGSQTILKPPLPTAIAAIAVELGIIYAILHFHEKAPRFVQMITASMGITIIGNLLILLSLQIKELVFFQSLVQIWGLYLSIIILKEVLECSFFKSLALTFASFFITIILLFGMFGDTAMIEEMERQRTSQPQQKTQQ